MSARTFASVVVLLAALGQAQPRPPPPRPGTGGPAAAPSGTAQENLAALDAIMAAPPTDPSQATEKVRSICDTMRTFFDEQAQPRGAKTPKERVPAGELATQAMAWQFTCDRATKAATTLAALGNVITSWEKKWLPPLRTKKARYLELAKSLNGEYAQFQRACAPAKCSEKDFEAARTRFKRAVAGADTLGRGLEDLRTSVEDGLKNADPALTFNDAVKDLVTTLAAPPKTLSPADPLWARLQKWRELVVERHRQARETYLAVEKEAKPVRDGTLLRSESAPIGGLAPKEIHSTFVALLDQLTAQRNAGQAKAEAEERRWEEDRVRVLKLNEPGPAVFRTLKTREEQLRRSQGDESGTQQGVTSGVRPKIDQLRIETDVAKRNRELNDKEIETIVRENAARRSALGLAPRPLL